MGGLERMKFRASGKLKGEGQFGGRRW